MSPPYRHIAHFVLSYNLGDGIIEGDDIDGGGVNVAARLEGLADPGGILISGTAYDQVEGRLDCGVEFSRDGTDRRRPTSRSR